MAKRADRFYDVGVIGGLDSPRLHPLLTTMYGEYAIRPPIVKQVLKDVLRPDDMNVPRGVADIAAAIILAVRHENKTSQSRDGRDRYNVADVSEALTLLLESCTADPAGDD